MTLHAEYALRRPRVFEVLNLLLAIPTSKTRGTERLISRQDSQILDFVPTGAAAVGTVVANQRPVAEEEEICVGVEESAAGVASETVDVPSVARCEMFNIPASQGDGQDCGCSIPSSKAFPSSSICNSTRQTVSHGGCTRCIPKWQLKNDARRGTYFAATFARIGCIILLHGRLGISRW